MGFNSFSKITIFLVMLSLLSLAVTAENETQGFDPSESFNWLIKHCEAGHCKDSTSDIMATSFYAMAMKSSGYSNSYGQAAIDYLIDQKDDKNECFPKSRCKVKETAFALWALSNYGEDITGIEDYIKDELAAGLKENWWLQIITNAENKTCTIGYPYEGALEQEEVIVDKGTFPDCQVGQPETYFDLNDCLKTNLLNLNPAIELTIDCSNIGSGTKIVIIYNTGTEFYLTEEATTSKYQTQIENACHTLNGACDKDTSLWANWILSTKRSDLSTNLYLFTEYDNLAPIDTSLLYLSTQDNEKQNKYIEELKNIQRLDGSFNTNDFQTAMAIMALHASASTEEVSEAIKYLESSVRSDGSWGGSVLTTAATLYTAFSGASVTINPMPIGSEVPNSATCGDGYCDVTESSYSCPDDCKEDEICVVNNKCETEFGENTENCPLDCAANTPKETQETCGNDMMEGYEECDGFDDSNCSQGYYCTSQCVCAPEFEPIKEDKGFGWLISAILILVLIVVAYLFYNKHQKNNSKTIKPFSTGPDFFKSKPRSPGRGFSNSKKQYPAARSSSRKVAPKNTRSELELEKSIKEAQKLLGKK
jgi:hypothetical protein